MEILLLLILLLLAFTVLYSSHFSRGEITWQCLANGRYVFYMSHYQSCKDISFDFQNQLISISSSPLPTNEVMSITMKPDSNRFATARNKERVKFKAINKICEQRYCYPLCLLVNKLTKLT